MRLTFKLYASLTQYLPSNSNNQSVEIEISEIDTPYTLLERFNVPKESAHLFLLNGLYLQPEEREQSVFKDGDTLAIWPPVAGG